MRKHFRITNQKRKAISASIILVKFGNFFGSIPISLDVLTYLNLNLIRGTVKCLHEKKSNYWVLVIITSNPAGIYLLKVNNRNTRTRCKICLKLTIKIPEQRQYLKIFHTLFYCVSIVNLEHVIAGWEQLKRIFNDCIYKLMLLTL